MVTIDFFFDLSSPWTCLAFHNIQPLIAARDVTIRWRPFLVGGVHNAVNQAYPEDRRTMPSRAKWRHIAQSLRDWAAYSGVTMNFPGPHFPLRSVHAMRFCCLLESDQEALHRFAHAAFEAYYTRQENLDDPEVLAVVASAVGLDGETLRAQSQEQACKDHLRANTDEAIARGAFGSPSIFVPFEDSERMYFGNDQLPLVAWALDQR
ncbi:MAG: 2-hydroxychromene-2-carboxylate isomerase [Myxococcota bacterium]